MISLIFISSLQVYAFEDCIIMADGKLTDISIENNTIVDVYPLITIKNEKNTLMVSPVKVGNTKVCVLKNNKEKLMFNVEVLENKTLISKIDGCHILSLDSPLQDDEIYLDEPPMLKEVK